MTQQTRLKTLQSKNYPGVQHVDVEATVEHIKLLFQKNQSVELIAKQNQISRVALVIKRVQEQCKCQIDSMKASSEQQKIGEDKSRTNLIFKTIFRRQK